jgi:hypothetical protein
MSSLLKSLSTLVNGSASRPADRDTQADAGPSTLTTPLIPLDGSDAPVQPAVHKPARKPATSRALNAVVRSTRQVALTHVEPSAQPKVARTGHRSTVPLTETEKLRLQIMQVQIKLSGLVLYDGTIDGVMNPGLVDGVRHFQTLKSMRDSGLLTTGTLAALGIQALD